MRQTNEKQPYARPRIIGVNPFWLGLLIVLAVSFSISTLVVGVRAGWFANDDSLANASPAISDYLEQAQMVEATRRPAQLATQAQYATGRAEVRVQQTEVMRVQTATAQSVGATQQARITQTSNAVVTLVARPTVTPAVDEPIGTVVFQECRNIEGTLTFAMFAPESLHALKTVSYTVPVGEYRLRIIWLDNPDLDVDIQIEIIGGTQFVALGDQCPEQAERS